MYNVNYCLQMYGDNLKNLEAISMDLIGDMLEELRLVSTQGPLDIYPIYHKCITGILTSVVGFLEVSKFIDVK